MIYYFYVLFKSALSQVFRQKNIKDILPKMDFCVKRGMLQLDSFARTGEEVRYNSKFLAINVEGRPKK